MWGDLVRVAAPRALAADIRVARRHGHNRIPTNVGEIIKQWTMCMGFWPRLPPDLATLSVQVRRNASGDDLDQSAQSPPWRTVPLSVDQPMTNEARRSVFCSQWISSSYHIAKFGLGPP